MPTNPYEHLPISAYWKTGVTQENPYKIQNTYKKKFNIKSTTKIATTGSYFAQHISRYLKKNGYNVLDFEQPRQVYLKIIIINLASLYIVPVMAIFTRYANYCSLPKK